MPSLVSALRRFTAHFQRGQHRPQAKWLLDMLTGILTSHSLMLSEIGRTLRERQSNGLSRRLIHTVKRLSRNLNSDRFDDDALMDAWWSRVEQFTTPKDGEGVVVAIDYTDIQKPFARPDRPKGMELACQCHDGSTKTRGMGYPVVQIDGTTADGIRFPILYRPYSFDLPTHKSQNSEFVAGIKEAAPHVGPRAWWVADRGFDGRNYFEAFDKAGLRWIVRLKVGGQTDRGLEDASGFKGSVYSVACRAVDRWTFDHVRGRGRKRRVLRITFGSRKVWALGEKRWKKYPRMGPARTLVVVYGFGKMPLVLLASEHLPGRKNALAILKTYIRRWHAEETTRAMKDSRRWGVRLEDFRALRFRGICRLVMLAALVFLFLAVVQASSNLTRWILSFVLTFDDPTTDLRYQLMRGIEMILGPRDRPRIRQVNNG